MDGRLEKQREIETEAAEKGIERFDQMMNKARQKGREDQTPVGNAMVRRIKAAMVPLYLADLGKLNGGRAVKGGGALKVLRKLDPEAVCEGAARAALAQMHRPNRKATTVARHIGDALEDQLVWARWRELNKPQADAVQKRVNQSPSAHQRRASLRGFARHWQEEAIADQWSSYRRISVGMRFIDYLVRLEVFEMIKIPTRGKKAAHGVRLTVAAAGHAKELADYLSVVRPLNWPLVVQPVAWTKPLGGGFHFRESLDSPNIPQALKPLPLVRRASKEQKIRLATADLSVVYAGLNAAQATAWRINPKVYPVLVELMKDGRGPGLTPFDPMEEPGRLPNEEAKDPDKLKAHKARIRDIKRHNKTQGSKRIAQHRTFKVAEKFVTEERIYFAYNLDFRGRVFACSNDLSPQGNDLQRGLLEFADGDPLDVSGLHWLKIHLANCYGVDKVSFEDRVKWADDNATAIVRAANEPLDSDWWYKADQPWQFLAACFAWAEYRDNPEGPCRIPVMLDGSCSGIQHYAALLRDEEAGREVNLVPGDKPGDLYATVAERVMTLLAKSREPFAAEWHAWEINRKITKGSVMTLPYGATFLANLDSVRDAVRERLDRDGTPDWLVHAEAEQKRRRQENPKDKRPGPYVVLAQVVWKAMQEEVRGPLKGMKWVKSLVSEWAQQRPKTALNWTTPSGFPVVTDYRNEKRGKTVLALINGEKVSMGTWEPLETFDWKETATAAAPNFVHSLDASHLIFSLKAASEAGITNLAVVHDAFGTTPTKTARFAKVLREEFARLYEKSLFECLGGAAKAAGVVFPEPPVPGSLVVADIATSKYLFA